MPRLKKDPQYRHFKPRNLAVVRIDGKDCYLGPFQSPSSWEKYHRLLAEWRSSASNSVVSVPREQGAFFGINCLVEQFLEHARQYYRRDGKPTGEVKEYAYAAEVLCELFGLTDANVFGPKSLELVQSTMLTRKWSRGVINQRVNRIRRIFKWAVRKELVSPSVLYGLRTVDGLRFGRTEAKETEPVKPVADEHVDATLPFLTPHVATMVRLQRLTGMRPCEVVMMRPCDIDRSGKIWVYEPFHHKNLWRGHQRLIPLGPKAQKLLKPFLKRAAEAFLFSPAESEKLRNAKRREVRKTPMTPSQAKRERKAKPKRPKRDRYDTSSYRRAIEYAVRAANRKRGEEEAKIPKWYPLQLRHTRATEVRRRYGLDGAQSALGHKNADVTQVYAERNLALATRIAEETG